MKYLFAIYLLVLGVLAPFAMAAPVPVHTLDYSQYAKLLKTYVNNKGMVDYNGLKASRSDLDNFTKYLAEFDSKDFEKLTEKQKIAFWINAYNTFTLTAIIDHYPIKPSFFKSVKYPSNSIRQIPGVWDKLKFEILGKKLTLSHIEHEILRKQFNEPGIHMALVCAAMGCPVLRNEPYIGQSLDEQLDDQAVKFLNDPTKFKIDHKKKTIEISPILKWFAKDFAKGYKQKSIKHSRVERIAVTYFLKEHLDKNDPYLRPRKYVYKIKFMSYNWSLNEQKKTNQEATEK